MTENVEKWLPEAVGGGEDAGFTEALAAELRPAALAEFEKAQAAVFLAGAEVGSSPLAPQFSDLKDARLDFDTCRAYSDYDVSRNANSPRASGILSNPWALIRSLHIHLINPDENL